MVLGVGGHLNFERTLRQTEEHDISPSGIPDALSRVKGY